MILQRGAVRIQIGSEGRGRGGAQQLNKGLIFQGYKNLRQTAFLLLNYVNREGVDQFVGKKAAGEFPPLATPPPLTHPLNLAYERGAVEKGFLLFLHYGALIAEEIADTIEEIGEKIPGVSQNVPAKESFSGPALDDKKRGRAAENFPHLFELAGKQTAKNWMNARACIIISLGPDFFSAGIVIPMLRMVKNQVHEFREGDPPNLLNPVHQDCPQFFIFWLCHVCYYSQNSQSRVVKSGFEDPRIQEKNLET